MIQSLPITPKRWRSGADNYFAQPYPTEERSLNEHRNERLSQYLPKVAELDKITAEAIDLIQNRPNNRPKKLLNDKTPNKVYDVMHLAA